VIALPFNDLRCLGSITEVVAELVTHRDEVLLELAEKYPTTDALAGYIRSLPQRDDDGEKHDGPKVETCAPPQRLRLPAPDPNCVERAALYVAVGELIDPRPVRQLATLDTPIGLHTFPVENGAPVILDPRVPRNCLDCGVMFLSQAPVAIAPRDAVEWTAQLAEVGAAHLRNGPSLVRRARDVMMRLVDEGVAPAEEWEIEAVAWLLALAEGVSRKYGKRALAMVRSTAQAIADLADDALARTQPRNIAWPLVVSVVSQTPWMSALARIAGRVGLDVGAVALKSKLAGLGVTPQMLGVLEEELNREGMTLGPLTKPSRFATFASIGSKSAA
jgi:hypothetical protein